MTLREHGITPFTTGFFSADVSPEQYALFQDRFAQLLQIYRRDLPGKLELIIADWNELRQAWERPLAERFYRNVHTLAGSGATFGFTKLSDVARELMQLVKPALALEHLPDAAFAAQATRLLVELCRTAEIDESSVRQGVALLVQCRTIDGRRAERSVFPVECDAAFVASIARRLVCSGYDVEIVNVISVGDFYIL